MSEFRPVAGVVAMVMVTTLLMPSTLYAQQAAQQPAQQEQDAEQETDASDNAAENTDEETQNDLPDIDNQPIQPGSGGPGRFIPSEQISQDLGVSFPVDI